MGEPLIVRLEKVPTDVLEILSMRIHDWRLAIPRQVLRYLSHYDIRMVGELFLLSERAWKNRRIKEARYCRELVAALGLPASLDLEEAGWRPWYLEHPQVLAAWSIRMHELGRLSGAERHREGPFPVVACDAEDGCVSVGEFIRDRAKSAWRARTTFRFYAFFAYHGLYRGMYVPKGWEPPPRDPEGCTRHGRILWEDEWVVPYFKEQFVGKGFETLESLTTLTQFEFRERFGKEDMRLIEMMKKRGLSFRPASPEDEMLNAWIDLELSVRTESGLKNAGILTYKDLTALSVADLLRMPNFGRKSVNELIECLEEKGLKLKDS